MKVFHSFCVCCAIALCNIASGWAAASRDVPIGDPTYRYLDILTAAHLVDSIIYGQRPFARAEAARITTAAREAFAQHALSPAHAATVTRTLEWLETEYADEIAGVHTKVTPIATAMQSVSGLKGLPRPVPADNGLQFITAQANPLTANRSGYDVPDGFQSAIATTHYAQVSPYAAIALEPRFIGEAFRNGDGRVHATLQQGYAKFEAGDFELLVGRDNLLFGPAEHGGTLLSTNAPPLNMVRLNNPRPFHLPWVFRHIGAMKGTMFFADLGNDYAPAHTILSGYRLDIQPKPWITFGVNHTLMMGGRGMPGPRIGNAVSQFLGIAGAITPGGGTATSNHIFGWDLHVQIPQWRGAQIYGLYSYDDPDNNFDIQLNKEAAWIGGVYLPRLTDDGRWGLRAEYLRAGAGMYRHYQYTNGWAINGHSLGLPYGGDSQAGLITVGYQVPGKPSLHGQFGVVQRSGDLYTNVGGTSNRLGIQKIVNNPDELSSHLSAKTTIPVRRDITLTLVGGYEHAWNANFVQGRQQNNLLATAGLTFRLNDR